MRTSIWLGSVLGVVLSGLASAQSYNGTWSITPTVQFSCMGGLVQFSIQRFVLSGTYPQASIMLVPTFSAGFLAGNFASPNSLTATRVLPGSCTETYQITLSFPTSTQCTGTFTANYTGAGCTTIFGSCMQQSWQFTGVLQQPASYATFGAGCAGSLGVTHLQPQALPRLGTTCQIQLDHLPLGFAVLVTGFSNTTSSLGALPAPLAAFGMPGCMSRTSLDVTEFVNGTGTTATWSLAVPNAAAFLGMVFHQQALVPSPGTNAAGAVVSDAATALVGV
jgi:hypothetical protein